MDPFWHRASGLSYGAFLREKGFHDTGVPAMLHAAGEAVSAIPESTRTLLGSMETIWNRMSQAIDRLNGERREMNSAFQWGFSEVLAGMGGMGAPMQELVAKARTPAHAASIEHFETARDMFRKDLLEDCLEALALAIDGDARVVGYKHEWRFHFLRGLVRLGSYHNHDEGLIDLAQAERSFSMAARYAKADEPRDAAVAMLAAGFAAYARSDALPAKCAEGLDLALEAVSLDPSFGEGWFQIAKFRMAVDEPERALEALRDAVDLDPVYAVKACADGDFRRHSGMLRDFVDALRKEKTADLAGPAAEALAELWGHASKNGELAAHRAFAMWKDLSSPAPATPFLDVSTYGAAGLARDRREIADRMKELRAQRWIERRVLAAPVPEGAGIEEACEVEETCEVEEPYEEEETALVEEPCEEEEEYEVEEPFQVLEAYTDGPDGARAGEKPGATPGTRRLRLVSKVRKVTRKRTVTRTRLVEVTRKVQKTRKVTRTRMVQGTMKVSSAAPVPPKVPALVLVDGLGEVCQTARTPRFVRIPPGRFVMGSPPEEPGCDEDERLHEVILARGFDMMTTPVTQAQYELLMGDNPSTHKGFELPVTSVSWFDAIRFCNAMSWAAGLDEAYVFRGQDVIWKGLDCNGYRLPTEAEWEYACRAGNPDARYGEPDAIAWHEGNSGGEARDVGTRAPNAWGLHDMLGNVWEWCWDWKADYPAGPVTDPTGPATGQKRVLRGGCYGSRPPGCRAAVRRSYSPGYRNVYRGFRLTRTVT